MPDEAKPDNIPSFEDVEKALGLDAMNFMSEMLSQPEKEEE